MKRFLPVQIALGLVLLIVPWSTGGYSIAMALALLASLVAMRRDNFSQRHPFLIPSLVWAVALVASFFWSDAARAGDEARTYYPFLLVFIASSAISTRSQARKLLLAFLLSAIAAAIAAVVEHYWAIGVEARNGRYSGHLTIVTYAMIVVNGYIVSALMFCYAERVWSRVVLLCSGVLMLAAVDLNGTRAAILAIALAIGSMMVLLPKRRKRLLVFVSPVLLLFVVLPNSNLYDRFVQQSEQFDFSDDKVDIRQTLWVSALRMTQAHPLMGVGVGGYQPERDRMFADGEMEGYPLPGPGYIHAHNIPLHICATMGLLGLAAAIYWFGSYPLWFVRRRRVCPPAAALAVALVMVVLGFGTLETALLNSRTTGVLAICLGAALGVTRAELQSGEDS
jgi:O-antigen ligase